MADPFDGGRMLPLVEEFYSLQGEGFHSGKAAYFIRLGGCDVGCRWCDAKMTWDARRFPPVAVDAIVANVVASGAKALVITGGEPLQYPLGYLTSQLRAAGEAGCGERASRPGLTACASQALAVPFSAPAKTAAAGIELFLETSGAYPLSGTFDWVCLSPKRQRPPLDELFARADELKIIVEGEEDLRWAEECAARVRPGCLLYLQPEWSRYGQAIPTVVEYAKAHPQWMVSLQIHKFMHIP